MKLALETISTCNRFCSTCLRNSHPDREKVAPWFELNLMPMRIIWEAFEQFSKMDFVSKEVCLSHYNEPLMDERIVYIATMAKAYNFDSVYLNTNGDYLVEEVATSLDSILSMIRISTRKEELKSYFQKTKVQFTKGVHIATHFSPKFDTEKLAQENKDKICAEPPKRIIINHKGQYLMCCEDIVGEFYLGSFPETSLLIHEMDKFDIQIGLDKPLGRHKYPYCQTCPRS